jgi:hypothetical protein
MDTLIKQELHKLIDNCDNELLLQEAKNILQNNDEKDWWDELTEDDKNSLTKSESQYAHGDFITHDQLMHQFEAWKRK